MNAILRLLLLACPAAVLNSVPVVHAQAPAAPPAGGQMPEVVVVGTPIIESNRVEPVAGQVTSVTQQQMDDLNAQDLPSALRMTPGVVISRHNPIGSFGGGEGGAVFIRGHGSSRPGAEIGIFVDGVPKYVSVWTHPLMDTISVDIAERVDVYKGAQPVLFGNMTYGAINLIPKQQRTDGYATSLEFAYGSFDTWIEVAEHGGKSGALDYYVVQSYRASDGHRDYSDGEVQDYFGQVGFAINENWSARLLFEGDLSSALDPGPDPDLVSPNQVFRNGRFEIEDYFTVATLAHAYDVAEGYVKLYWDNGALDWTEQFNTARRMNIDDTLTRYDNYGIKGRETFHLWEGGEILVGCDLDYLSGRANFITQPHPAREFDRDTFQIVSPHFAISHRFDIAEDVYLTPSAGLRCMLHDQFRDETAPQGGLLLHVKDTEIHANYARGVNFPGIFNRTLSDMFMPGENDWESLTAETVDHYEFGVSQSFAKIVKLDCTAFYDEGHDRIVVAPPPPFPPVWRNIDVTRTRGVETSVTVNPCKNLALFAGFTWLIADPEQLPYTPQWSASAGLNYRFLEHFRISLDAMFVDDQFVTSWGRRREAISTDEVNSYVLVNAKLTYDFELPAWRLKEQILAASENLMDEKFEQKFGCPMPGISGMFGFKLKL